jgi:Zn-dependent peptidase ImmA (M78 family)
MDEKPPASVMVGPYRYKVVVDDARIPPDLYGLCDKGKHTISLHPDQSAVRLRSTLVHELLHALCDLTGVDDDKAEERIVTVLAPALLEVLRKNPRLVDWLTE